MEWTCRITDKATIALGRSNATLFKDLIQNEQLKNNEQTQNDTKTQNKQQQQ